MVCRGAEGRSQVAGAFRAANDTSFAVAVDVVPEGLTPADWNSIRAAFEAEQHANLKASNTGVEDKFGYSVAVSGDPGEGEGI